jgi:ribosomal protein S18 acetylase RimI-like enzyme
LHPDGGLAAFDAFAASRETVHSEGCRVSWHFDPFDSENFGLKMGRVAAGFGVESASLGALEALVNAADEADYDHLTVRLPSEDPALIRRFQRVGFFVVDAHSTLKKKVEAVETAPPSIESATPEDLAAVQELGAEAFALSRYAWDPLMSLEGRRRTMERWIENDFRTRAEFVLVARGETGSMDGFIAVLLNRAERLAVIDLIAVHPRAQGRGFGLGLIKESERRLAGLADRFQVGTQGSNLGAHKLYAKAGFVMATTDITMHRHRGGVIPV